MPRWSFLTAFAAVAAAAVVTFAAGSARADILSNCGGAVFNGNETKIYSQHHHVNHPTAQQLWFCLHYRTH